LDIAVSGDDQVAPRRRPDWPIDFYARDLCRAFRVAEAREYRIAGVNAGLSTRERAFIAVAFAILQTRQAA